MAIVLQEIVSIDRGGKEAYLEGVRTRWAPYAEASRGMRLVWLGSTIGSTAAWPEAIVLWELRDWAHYADVCGRMYSESSDDAELVSWWRDAAKLRLRSRSQTLVPAPFSPTLDRCVERGISGTAFAFSTYRITPGRFGEFSSSLERLLPAEEARGRRLVGAYEVAFTNHLAYAVWAHEGIAELAVYERERNAARLAACESWSEHWGFATPGTPLWPKQRPGGAKVW